MDRRDFSRLAEWRFCGETEEMGLGTKNRQQQTAEACKQHLRTEHPDKLGLVNEYIEEFEGVGKSHDMTRWSLFTDIKGIKEEMLMRLDDHFEAWLNPPA